MGFFSYRAARLWCAVGACAAVRVSVAHADQAKTPVMVHIDPAANLPFTPDELGAAISLRVDRRRLTAPVTVSIDRLDAPRSFRIGVGGRRRDVQIDSGLGPYAVRTLALLAVDLVESQPPVSPGPAAPPPPAWSVGLEALGAPVGTGGDGSRLEGHVEVNRRLSPRSWATAAAGYGRVTRSTMGLNLTVDSVPIRAGLGIDLGRCELRTTAAMRVFRAGATSGVVYGGWLDMRLAVYRGVAEELTLVVAAELATERLQVRPLQSAPVFTSGYVTPWVGLALSTP